MLVGRCIALRPAGPRGAFSALRLNPHHRSNGALSSSSSSSSSSFSSFQATSKLPSSPPTPTHHQLLQQQQQQRCYAKITKMQFDAEIEKAKRKPKFGFASGYAWDQVPGYQYFLAPVMIKDEINRIIKLPPEQRENIVLIDLRPVRMFNDYIIPGAVNIPVIDIWLHRGAELAPSAFLREFGFPKPDVCQHLVFYSDTPEDGDFAAFAFNVNGYPHCYNYRGGIRDFFNLNSEQFQVAKQPVWAGLSSEKPRKHKTLAQMTKDAIRDASDASEEDERERGGERGPEEEGAAEDGGPEEEGAAARASEGYGDEYGAEDYGDEYGDDYDDEAMTEKISDAPESGSWKGHSETIRRPGRGVSRFSR